MDENRMPLIGDKEPEFRAMTPEEAEARLNSDDPKLRPLTWYLTVKDMD